MPITDRQAAAPMTDHEHARAIAERHVTLRQCACVPEPEHDSDWCPTCGGATSLSNQLLSASKHLDLTVEQALLMRKAAGQLRALSLTADTARAQGAKTAFEEAQKTTEQFAGFYYGNGQSIPTTWLLLIERLRACASIAANSTPSGDPHGE